MTYQPEIPNPSSNPNDSALDIKNNFAQFATIFALNHLAMNDTNQGKHGTVILQKQTSDPGATEDLSVLFCKDTTTKAGIQPQLYAQVQQFLPTNIDHTKAPNTPVQLSYNSVGLAGPIYYSFLSGGYLIYFGSALKGATVTLTPTPTKILCAQVFPTGTGNANHGKPKTNVPYDAWVTISGATLTINSTRAPGGSTFLWMAIGSD